MAAFKLPDLPQGWLTQPQLFERYWFDVMRSIEGNINDILATEAQLAATQAELAATQAQLQATQEQLEITVAAVVAAQAAAEAAQTTADNAVPQTRQILTPGIGGLAGGGDLTANRSLSIADVIIAATKTFTVGAQSISITYNSKGQITNITIV